MDAHEIIVYVKNSRMDIFKFLGEEEINFLGCSEPYVREKTDALIYTLQQLKKHCKSIDKLNDIAKSND